MSRVGFNGVRRFNTEALRVAALLILIGLVGNAAFSQGSTGSFAGSFAGTFVGTSDAGQVTVELELLGQDLTGTLNATGVVFTLEGYVQDGVGAGLAYTAQGSVGFEAYLEGETLGLYLFEMDAAGAPIVETVIELLLTRRTTAVASPGPAGKLTAPASKQPNSATSPILASGSYAQLTEDNARAFIESLEFVLAQIGYAYTFTEAERAQALSAIAGNYATMTQMDQVVLSQARDIWQRVQVNWPSATLDQQREFALGVLILAFGEQTVSTWVAQNGGGGASGAGGGLAGGGNCTTFEDCTSGFVDEQTWSDTFNAQGCWAAAGCGGFDASTNSFDYDSY